MSILAFDAVQSTAKTTLEANAWVIANAIEVFVDNGRILQKVEQELNSGGHCIVVGLPQSASVTGQATGAAIFRTEFDVMILINPEKSDLDPITAFSEVAKCIMGYVVTNQANRFDLAASNEEIFGGVDGLFAVTVKFTKLCIIQQ